MLAHVLESNLEMALPIQLILFANHAIINVQHVLDLQLMSVQPVLMDITKMEQHEKYVILNVDFVMGLERHVVNKDMDMVKRKIKILQAGKGGSKQSQVKDLQGSIEFYASLRDQDYSKYIFFYELVEVLPLDISFFTLSVTPEKSGFKVLLKGQSYYQDSIYLFYDALQAKFKDVSLKDIKSQVKDDIALNIFSISFLWRVE